MSQPVAPAAPADAVAFYAECLELLGRSQVPYLLGGTHAVNAYAGTDRPVKDLDVFCRAGDYPRILSYLQRAGYAIEVEDEGEPAIKQFVAEGVEEAIRLETALRALGTERSVVVLHYAPVAATLEGEPREIFPFLGCSRLAETIDRFGVSAVVHGHAHLGTYAAVTAKGIPVYNCARSVAKPSGRPYALIEI